MDEVGHSLTGVFVGLSGLLAQIVHTTMDVAVLMQVIVALALNDAKRLLRSGGIVEID